MIHPTPQYHGSLFAASTTAATGGVAWIAQQLQAASPGWAMLPPLILSGASIWTAVLSGRKYLDDRRRADELHALEVARQQALLARVRSPLAFAADGPEHLEPR